MVFDYTLIRSRRRTLVLRITKDGRLEARAPLKMPVADIEAFIHKKSHLIEKRLNSLKANLFVPKTFVEGEDFLYLGQTYGLRFDDTISLPVELNRELKVATRHQHHPHKIILAWYKSEAVKVFNDRLSYWYKVMLIKPKAVKLSNATTKWGSCTGKGNIHLSWNLIMAPLEVIDYVIVHELAHLIQHNHSQAFWSKVAEYIPDYKTLRKWLKDHGGELRI